jgi:MSHA pilin protein MshA
VVIVILGILAAVALPRFIDLRQEAGTAAAQGVAGAVASATAINFSASLVGNASAVAITGNCATEATDLESIVTGVNWGTEYTIGGAGDCGPAGPGEAVSCTITGPSPLTTTANATVICTN